ncbi:uncharacterized protein LOC125507518 isoform X1 [Triticum urartu]|uniref:uncharacterized protein LOC125507518 isoform X1 n=1 Tax=Triticum urartu TaxID=4572 RepID=UPI0020435F30|nr:uncharacterized protein LOC125507518 isoform X1 [Triticum urartu]
MLVDLVVMLVLLRLPALFEVSQCPFPIFEDKLEFKVENILWNATSYRKGDRLPKIHSSIEKRNGLGFESSTVPTLMKYLKLFMLSLMRNASGGWRCSKSTHKFASRHPRPSRPPRRLWAAQAEPSTVGASSHPALSPRRRRMTRPG